MATSIRGHFQLPQALVEHLVRHACTMEEQVPEHPEQRLLAPDEVALLCGLSRKAVYRAIERGELRASRLCSRLRIRPADVDEWIEANRLKSSAVDRHTYSVRAPAPNGLRRLLEDASAGRAR